MALLKSLEFFVAKFKYDWLVTITQQFCLIALINHSEPKRSACFYFALIRHSSHSKVELRSLFRTSYVWQRVWAYPQIVAVEFILSRGEQRCNVIFIVIGLFLIIWHGIIVCITCIICIINSLAIFFFFFFNFWNDVFLARKEVLALPEITRFKFTCYPDSIVEYECISIWKCLPPNWIVFKRWLRRCYRF